MAISPQGSRAGLITSVVIFAVLFVTATVFAIYFGVNAQKADESFNNYKKKYAGIVTDAGLASGDMQALRADATAAGAGTSAFDVLLQQRDRLTKVITGATTDVANAENVARTALTQSTAGLKESGVNLPSPADNVAGAIDTLTSAIATRDGQIKDLNAQIIAAKSETAAANKRIEDLTGERDKQVSEVRAEAEKQVADAVKARTDTEGNVTNIESSYDQKIRDSQEAANKQQVTLTDRERQIEQLTVEIGKHRAKLAGLRMNTINPVVRQEDGEIVRSPGNNVVYINLGFGDQISPGMTFEVYDKQDGIPALGEGTQEEELPVGKASIEVVRVGPTSSECRIVKQQMGATLTEGDPIVNLIYDRNTKYNFRVYGNFDLDQNGTATPGDAEIIKRLVTQWGGRLTDEVNTDTDFVILGKEPVLPNFSREDLNDPINAAKLAAAQAEVEKYDEVRSRAKDLHIPILNQNRFLYFIGYYDQAKR